MVNYIETMRQFTLEYWIDEGWYVGRLKEMPAVMSQGETLKELQAMIRDAYKLMVEDASEMYLCRLSGRNWRSRFENGGSLFVPWLSAAAI